eukprot:1812600-Prymnesium_polylepis.2
MPWGRWFDLARRTSVCLILGTSEYATPSVSSSSCAAFPPEKRKLGRHGRKFFHGSHMPAATTAHMPRQMTVPSIGRKRSLGAGLLMAPKNMMAMWSSIVRSTLERSCSSMPSSMDGGRRYQNTMAKRVKPANAWVQGGAAGRRGGGASEREQRGGGGPAGAHEEEGEGGPDISERVKGRIKEAEGDGLERDGVEVAHREDGRQP